MRVEAAEVRLKIQKLLLKIRLWLRHREVALAIRTQEIRMQNQLRIYLRD